jgi:hypothetical protein
VGYYLAISDFLLHRRHAFIKPFSRLGFLAELPVGHGQVEEIVIRIAAQLSGFFESLYGALKITIAVVGHAQCVPEMPSFRPS